MKNKSAWMNQLDKQRKDSTMTTQLDLNGYPFRPKSIFIGIQRQRIPEPIAFVKALGAGFEINILANQLGGWSTLVGTVSKITYFPDGRVIHYPQNLKYSFLKWPDAILWIPNQGECGILN